MYGGIVGLRFKNKSVAASGVGFGMAAFFRVHKSSDPCQEDRKQSGIFLLVVSRNTGISSLHNVFPYSPY